MKILYLVVAFGHEWHRIVLVTFDKETAIHLAKTHNCERGCQVWEHEADKFDAGKKVYPNW